MDSNHLISSLRSGFICFFFFKNCFPTEPFCSARLSLSLTLSFLVEDKGVEPLTPSLQS